MVPSPASSPALDGVSRACLYEARADRPQDMPPSTPLLPEKNKRNIIAYLDTVQQRQSKTRWCRLNPGRNGALFGWVFSMGAVTTSPHHLESPPGPAKAKEVMK